MAKAKSAKPADSSANLGFEAKLWLAAENMFSAPNEVSWRERQGKANRAHQPEFYCIASMHSESRALATLRETLLPKLLSAELVPSS
jgi:hypothetical protein